MSQALTVNEQVEFRMLIANAISGPLDEKEMAQFQAFLRFSSQAMAFYIETLNLYAIPKPDPAGMGPLKIFLSMSLPEGKGAKWLFFFLNSQTSKTSLRKRSNSFL